MSDYRQSQLRRLMQANAPLIPDVDLHVPCECGEPYLGEPNRASLRCWRCGKRITEAEAARRSLHEPDYFGQIPSLRDRMLQSFQEQDARDNQQIPLMWQTHHRIAKRERQLAVEKERQEERQKEQDARHESQDIRQAELMKRAHDLSEAEKAVEAAQAAAEDRAERLEIQADIMEEREAELDRMKMAKEFMDDDSWGKGGQHSDNEAYKLARSTLYSMSLLIGFVAMLATPIGGCYMDHLGRTRQSELLQYPLPSASWTVKGREEWSAGLDVARQRKIQKLLDEFRDDTKQVLDGNPKPSPRHFPAFIR